MDSNSLDKAITEILTNTYHGASTRHICNLVFERRTDKFIVVPGHEKMCYVYRRLAAMKKQGKVTSDYPGHWRIVEVKETTLP
jgi:hypothetical protein